MDRRRPFLNINVRFPSMLLRVGVLGCRLALELVSMVARIGYQDVESQTRKSARSTVKAVERADGMFQERLA